VRGYPQVTSGILDEEGEKMNWHQFDAKNPPQGTRLIVKMADANNNISYAIGMVDHRTGKLEILAQEKGGGTLPVYWMQIPD